jgi:hypothetical protein
MAAQSFHTRSLAVNNFAAKFRLRNEIWSLSVVVEYIEFIKFMEFNEYNIVLIGGV